MSEVLKDITEFTEASSSTESIKKLHEISRGDDSVFAANLAMALHVCLRTTQPAVATGHEISVLGQPSQTLLSDILLTMPIRDEKALPASKLLFDSYCTQLVKNSTSVSVFLASFVREVNHCMDDNHEITEDDRYQHSMNLQPAIHAIRTWNETYLSSFFDDDRRKLAHEGGDITIFDPDLYTQFASKDYLEVLMETVQLGGKAALSGPVRLRFLKESEYLHKQDRLI